MVFHDIVSAATRKGLKKTDHYRIKVMPDMLRPLIDEELLQDEAYIPLTGKILTYQKFYSLVCKGNHVKKEKARLEKEKLSIAKNNDLKQIEAMEKTDIEKLEQRSDIEKQKIIEKKTQFINSIDQVSDYENQERQRKTYDFMIEEVEKLLILQKNEKIDYYNSLKDLRVEYEVEKSALDEKKNLAKRQKRLEARRETIVDPNEIVVKTPVAVSSAAAAPLVSEENDLSDVNDTSSSNTSSNNNTTPQPISLILRSQSNVIESEKSKDLVKETVDRVGLSYYNNSNSTGDDNDTSSDYKSAEDH
jgi:hypothetical protein